MTWFTSIRRTQIIRLLLIRLSSSDEKYKHLVASGLMGVFTKIWAGVWSARMEYILNNTILALLDSPGNTLLGIARMLRQ
jgi:hypothetical protein